MNLESTMTQLVTYELHNGVATLSLNDGKANVMSLVMLQAINEALDRAQADQAVVVLASTARMFSSAARFRGNWWAIEA